MKNYEEFKEQFAQDVKAKLEEQGMDVDVKPGRVEKLNQSYDAITVTPVGEGLGVNLQMDKFYEAYSDGTSYEQIIDKAAEVATVGIEQKPEFNLSDLTDYSKMKETLALEVVSSETNKGMLETVPHKDIEDMSVVYRFVLSSDESGRQSVLVTNQMLESMGVTPEQLHADALENAPQLQPLEIKGMSEVLSELMGVEQAEMMGMTPVAPEDEAMFVASVPDKVHGAGVLAYESFMDQAAEKAGGDFFILPSSIHELLIVPDDGNVKLADLEAMVKEVNATQVAPEDKLTDSVYHYDSKEKIFELGEKYEERQAAKEAESSMDKAEEKGSVLGDLKAKKETVAKTPKKDVVEKTAKSKGGEAI